MANKSAHNEKSPGKIVFAATVAVVALATNTFLRSIPGPLERTLAYIVLVACVVVSLSALFSLLGRRS